MKELFHVGLVLGLAACGATEQSLEQPGPKAPNVILVMTDDQGWGDFSGNGNPVLETPMLDRLAGESARLADFYVHPVCTPTRAALITGRHPQRTRAFDTYVGRAMLEPEEVTIAEVLGDAGWRTGVFGKWHLGDCAPMRPLDQGFDRSLVHGGGGIGQPADPLGGEGKYTNPVLMDQGEERQFEGYCTDVYFDQAMDWMGAQDEAQERFFCYIATNAPHTPLHDVPDALYQKYRGRDLGAEVFAGGPGRAPANIDQDKLARLYAMIENIDENMGRLLGFLEERDLERDTLLIFLCDNGPQGRRFVGGMRGAKGNVYEGGVRSPLYVRWPGKLGVGLREGDFGAHLDIFPTILDACQVPVPEGVALDGRSLLPLLEGQDDLSARDPLVVQWNRGDGPIKGQNMFVRSGKWKLVNHPRADVREEAPPWQPELYDLEQDPFEQEDLSAKFSEVVEQLGGVYSDWYQDVNAGEGPGDSWTPSLPPHGPPPIRMGGAGAERVVLTRQDWRRTEGGGWGRNGVWKVRFSDSHFDSPSYKPWSVRVIFPRRFQPTKVKLGINSGVWTYITWEGEPGEGQSEITLQDVGRAWVKDKPATVNCVLTDGDGQEVGPYQLIFSR